MSSHFNSACRSSFLSWMVQAAVWLTTSDPIPAMVLVLIPFVTNPWIKLVPENRLAREGCPWPYLEILFLWMLFGSMRFHYVKEVSVGGPLCLSLHLGAGHTSLVTEYAINTRYCVLYLGT